MSIMTHDTPTALWHEIVLQAEQACSVMLKEELESYLVFLLMRYINKPEFIKNIIATEFLQSLDRNPIQREMLLRDVGDKCLLFSGLFPHIAKKRLVQVSYFVKLGQAAYFRISRKNNDLYNHLSMEFVPLMDILQSIRHYTQQYPDLLPLEAYDLWNDTGSQRALNVLKEYTHDSKAIPLSIIKKS